MRRPRPRRPLLPRSPPRCQSGPSQERLRQVPSKVLPSPRKSPTRRRKLTLLAVQSGHKPLGLATPKGIKEGDAITVVGHPGRHEGLIKELHVVTEGNIEGIVNIFGENWYHLKVDAAPGNSGGPVINS